MDDVDKQLRDRISEIFPSKDIQAKIVDLVVAKRPTGVSRKCHYPYYKEFYANQIKNEIDKMIQNKSSIIYRYSTFCEGDGAFSRQTLYLRVNHSIRYLLDNMDTPDKRYATWKKIVNITRDNKRGGVVIEFIPEFRGGESDKPFTGDQVTSDAIVPKTAGMPKWTVDMNNYLEDEDATKPFHVEGLALSPEEIFNLKVSLGELNNIMFSVTSSTLKIIKMQ